jgi:hypothetical protein
MKSALEFISKQTNLSSDVAEVIQKALNSWLERNICRKAPPLHNTSPH